MIKAVLFDIDGVLIDSEEANWRFYSTLFEKFNYRIPTKAEYRKAHHMTLINVIKTLTKEKNEEKINKIIDVALGNPNFYHELWVKPDELHETIEKLKKRFMLGVVTSRRLNGVNNFFKHSGLNIRDFDEVVSIDHHEKPKPHPEGLLLAVSNLNIKPDEAIYVGDASTDLIAAREAGVGFILYPPNLEIKTEFVAKEFKDIPRILDDYFSR